MCAVSTLLCMTTVAIPSTAEAQANAPALGQAVLPAIPKSVAKTQKPPLHGQRWMAITGKPLAATAGSMIFQRGGNAVDAACAMIAATSTMWDVLSWGGETQALIYDPRTKKVVAINGLGVAPTGATPEFYRGSGYRYPPEYGPLAAVTPGTPGGLMLMLQEYGTLSLAKCCSPRSNSPTAIRSTPRRPTTSSATRTSSSSGRIRSRSCCRTSARRARHRGR